jgi:hypothetical protein
METAMRNSLSFLVIIGLCLAVPAPSAAQKAKVPSVEQFDVSGLPGTATTDQEREILLLVQYHKRGDLKDATRIHMMLAQYYKKRGDRTRAANCESQATEAWEASEKGLRVSAGSPGSPPFEPVGTFTQAFGYTDDIGLTHRWEFFGDGTWSHAFADPKATDAKPLQELGWYAVTAGSVRLWRQEPSSDRVASFALQGKNGKDGLVLDGVPMRPVK